MDGGIDGDSALGPHHHSPDSSPRSSRLPLTSIGLHLHPAPTRHPLQGLGNLVPAAGLRTGPPVPVIFGRLKCLVPDSAGLHIWQTGDIVSLQPAPAGRSRSSSARGAEVQPAGPFGYGRNKWHQSELTFLFTRPKTKQFTVCLPMRDANMPILSIQTDIGGKPPPSASLLRHSNRPSPMFTSTWNPHQPKTRDRSPFA